MSALTVRPVRFTDHLAEMQRFLELLGLRTLIVSDGGGWCDLAGAAGRVALHSAADSSSGGLPGQTRLSFETADAAALAHRLSNGGVPGVTVFDEAYGRVLTCTDPDGATLAADERSDDLYGYRQGASDVEPTMRVRPVKFADPAGAYGQFLLVAGLTAVDDVRAFCRDFAADAGAQGTVRLRPGAGEPPVVASAGAAAVQLAFESPEPLAQVAERLTRGGFPANVLTDELGPLVSVRDADGQPVEVRQRARAS